MVKLRKKFSKSAWRDCCGKLCDDCKIAEAYIKEYGEYKGIKRLKRDPKKIGKIIK
jgi:phage-related protein